MRCGLPLLIAGLWSTACVTPGVLAAVFPKRVGEPLSDVAPDPSPGCSRATHPVSGESSIWSGGLSRHFIARAPAGPAPGPMPLVLNFHGLLESAHGQEMLTRMNEAAGKRGILVVYPQGVSWSWNAGSCCGRAFYEHVDDVRFVRELVDRLEHEYCIDRHRIYATGMSNGGLLSYRLACEASDVFAAIAPVAAIEAVESCHPKRPVPVLEFHGRADLVVPYRGGVWTFPSVEETIARWQGRDGCAGGPLATIYETGGVHCRAAQKCQAGSDVVLCEAEWGGHTWPGGMHVPWLGVTNDDVSATETMLDFFADHPMR